MSQRIDRYTVDNVLDLLDGSDSEIEGFGNETDDEFILYEQDLSSESDDDPTEEETVPNAGEVKVCSSSSFEESDWGPEDDQPLSSIAALTPTADYKWSDDELVPPNNIEFCGNTELPELPADRDGEVTPYGVLKTFITDEMLQSVADETNRYCVEKDGRSINTSRQELEKLIGMFYYMPSLRSYWESELRYEAVAKVMSRDHFLKLVTELHFVDNNAITDEEKLDKLWKLRPWFEALRQNFSQIPPKEFQSIYKIIIPFKGRFSLKVYMPKKPHKWGFKLWGRSDSDGYIYDFDLCQPVPDNLVSELGRSAGVVEKMTESLPDGKNFKVYADNYFSSVPLAEKLKKRQIWYIGTVKMNRVTKNGLPSDKELKKVDRGHYVAQVEKNSNVVCVRWKDKKVVTLISTFVGTQPVTQARRWNKKEKRHVSIERPKIVEEYN